ncbi:MAG: tetratricopeptide repeat protein [Pseudomonadota bacterium]
MTTTAPALAQNTASEDASSNLPALEQPALPPGLAASAAERDESDAVEGRTLTDSAMARASGAYLTGDYDLALIHAERAAAAGEPRGATLAGHIRLHGLAGEVDEDGALRWFRRAAEVGEPDALIALGQMARAGRGGLSAGQAADFLRRAAETGDANGALAYGVHQIERGDPGAAQTALDWLQLAAESGHAPAYAQYAYALDQWVHGPRDAALARPWYVRAGEAGDPPSALQAGLMVLGGEGGPADTAEGVRLLRLAAEYGLPQAMGQLALILFQGAGDMPPDPVAAASWAAQGAQAGDAESRFLYAYALATGDGASQSLEQAYYWALRAGEPGPDSLAQDNDRTRLESALERALDPQTAARIRAEAMLNASERFSPAETGDP